MILTGGETTLYGNTSGVRGSREEHFDRLPLMASPGP